MYRHVCVHVHIDAWVQTARNAASFFSSACILFQRRFQTARNTTLFSPSTNLEYHSRVGLLIVWFLIVCVYVYTFLHAFISECLWCRPNTFQKSTECCLFFSECLCSFPKTFSNSTECCPFFSEYESIPITTPECESRILIPSTTPE